MSELTQTKSAPRVSVLLPVKNAGELLDHVLRSIERKRGVDFELLIVDSGSSDGTLERIQKFAQRINDNHVAQLQTAGLTTVRVLQIKPSEFGHGRTRNLLAREARGELLVFLTHDASPLTPDWLQHMIAPFDNPKVGLVFGPQRSRPDGNPVIRAELLVFFAGFAEKNSTGQERTTVYATKAAAGVDRVGSADNEVLRFSSDVNAAIRKSAWEQCNFRDVTYCEDQLMAHDLLERGWYKVYEPRAAVYHSHNFGTLEFFRRYVDEWQGMFKSFGYVDVKHVWHLPMRIVRGILATRHALLSDPRLALWQKILWYPRAAALATMRQIGGYLGPRLERIPMSIRKRISREYHLINA